MAWTNEMRQKSIESRRRNAEARKREQEMAGKAAHGNGKDVSPPTHKSVRRRRKTIAGAAIWVHRPAAKKLNSIAKRANSEFGLNWRAADVIDYLLKKAGY